MAGKDSGWRWEVPAKVLAKPVSIRMPRGMYSMQIAAAHHKLDRRPVKIDAADVPMQVVLAPLPAVTGRVVTLKKSGDDKEPKETAVGGAQIARSDGKIIGSANEQGAFRVEIADPPTEELVIASPGLGTRVVPLHILAADTDLGIIRLSSGVKLAVHIARADSVRSKALHAKLTEASKTQYENTHIATRELKAGEDDLVFAGSLRGGVLPHVERRRSAGKTDDGHSDQGGERLERDSPDAVPSSGERCGSETSRCATAASACTTSITHGTRTRRSTTRDISADRCGRSEGIGGWVKSKETGAMPVDKSPTLEGDPATWDITFKRRLITGRIFDAETKEPVARADLHMELETKSTLRTVRRRVSRLYSTIDIGADGAYSILATKDGIYDLAVTPPEHVSQKTTIDIGAEDESKTADFPLTKGIEQIIDFVWPNGDPVANAMVMEGVARDGHNAAWMAGTDAVGTPEGAHARRRYEDALHRAEGRIVRTGARRRRRKQAAARRRPAARGLASVHVQRCPAETDLGDRGDAMEWRVGAGIGRRTFEDRANRCGRGPHGTSAGRIVQLWGRRPGLLPTLAPPAREPVRVGLSSGEQSVEIVVP